MTPTDRQSQDLHLQLSKYVPNQAPATSLQPSCGVMLRENLKKVTQNRTLHRKLLKKIPSPMAWYNDKKR